jgi:hypothetical protein
METNTPRLVDLVQQLVSKTEEGKKEGKEVHWVLLDDGRSYQLLGPRAVVIITSEGDRGEGPYSLMLRDATGTDTGKLLETEGSDWNPSLSYLYSLAARTSSSSSDNILASLGLSTHPSPSG